MVMMLFHHWCLRWSFSCKALLAFVKNAKCVYVSFVKNKRECVCGGQVMPFFGWRGRKKNSVYYVFCLSLEGGRDLVGKQKKWGRQRGHTQTKIVAIILCERRGEIDFENPLFFCISFFQQNVCFLILQLHDELWWFGAFYKKMKWQKKIVVVFYLLGLSGFRVSGWEMMRMTHTQQNYKISLIIVIDNYFCWGWSTHKKTPCVHWKIINT